MVVQNATGTWCKFFLFEDGDARCEVPMADAGGEQGLLERANNGCISEVLPGNGTVSWVDTVAYHGGVRLLTVAAYDQAACDESHPRSTSANYSFGELNSELHSASIPENVCHLVARPLSLQQSVVDGIDLSPFGTAPIYRRLRGFRNSTGSYVSSTYYIDAWCQNRTSSYDTALGAQCFEAVDNGVAVPSNMSFSLSWDASASLVTQKAFRGKTCVQPHTFPVNWALGDLNTNRSSYRAVDGECFRHFCGTSHLSQDAPSYSTLKGFRNLSGEFIRRSHFSDSMCSMLVFTEVVSSQTCAKDSVVAQSRNLNVQRKQSWFAVWDAEHQATTVTVFVGHGCAVPAAYAVYHSSGHGGDKVRAPRRLQEQGKGTNDNLWTVVLLVGGLLCGCLSCYYCLFVLMAREVEREDATAQNRVQP